MLTTNGEMLQATRKETDNNATLIHKLIFLHDISQSFELIV